MKKNLLVISFLLLLATPACSTSSPQTELTTAPTIQPIATLPQIQGQTDLPLTEADVPRVPVDEAKAAFDNGKAIIVDVRSAEAYTAGHAVGAINIPLVEFENNIGSVPLNKDQWIITYCT
jgi:3-mercaptopyruvate sulfurtransferase SseA